jgi:hypothetical protein
VTIRGAGQKLKIFFKFFKIKTPIFINVSKYRINIPKTKITTENLDKSSGIVIKRDKIAKPPIYAPKSTRLISSPHPITNPNVRNVL